MRETHKFGVRTKNANIPSSIDPQTFTICNEKQCEETLDKLKTLGVNNISFTENEEGENS